MLKIFLMTDFAKDFAKQKLMDKKGMHKSKNLVPKLTVIPKYYFKNSKSYRRCENDYLTSIKLDKHKSLKHDFR